MADRAGKARKRGKPEAQARADEQSYESILLMKVENRRAPGRGGHGIHWREGTSRVMYRCSDTGMLHQALVTRRR